MPKKPPYQAAHPDDLAMVVKDLLSFWLPSFLNLNWKDRLDLLDQIDLQLSSDFGGGPVHRTLSQAFTSAILNKIPLDQIKCQDQANFFLNSDDDRHHQAARIWFILNQVGLGDQTNSTKALRSEQRLGERHSVHLPGVITSNDNYTLGQLVDISATGAKVSVDAPPPAGSTVMLDILFLGRVAALVVWAATTFVGLSFVTDQMVLVVS